MPAAQYTVEACPPVLTTSSKHVMAMRLAFKYQHRTPTPQELMADYGMSRATAFRWVSAYKIAKGEA